MVAALFITSRLCSHVDHEAPEARVEPGASWHSGRHVALAGERASLAECGLAVTATSYAPAAPAGARTNGRRL